jgi:hypothetical protein
MGHGLMGPFRSRVHPRSPGGNRGHNSCASKAAVSPLDFVSQSVLSHDRRRRRRRRCWQVYTCTRSGTEYAANQQQSWCNAVRIHQIMNASACLEHKEHFNHGTFPFSLQFED